MAHQFAQLMFTPGVRAAQARHGSREAYAALEAGGTSNHELSQREQDFIAARDSFYMASVSETGWPYLQHRGGPAGFIKVLDERTLGFADYRGNRQYISVGNLEHDARVALLFMDYPNRRRLKLLGTVGLVSAAEAADRGLVDPNRRVERGFIVRVAAFDWNCPQHITPRYTAAEMAAATATAAAKGAASRAHAPAEL